MVDYCQSSQLNQWLFASQEALSQCRSRANMRARDFLQKSDQDTSPQVLDDGRGYQFQDSVDYSSQGPLESSKGHSYLTFSEEITLIRFYASKLPALLGPAGQIRRDAKVVSTAAMFYCRFYLSNSVMVFDPKACMVAAAFLATKAEDCTVHTQQLVTATQALQAPVTVAEILAAELALIEGIQFELRCFHPYSALQALTDNWRLFGKKDVDVRHDWKTMYEKARGLVDRAVVETDLLLLASPGQIGFAALCVTKVSTLNLEAYVQDRFPKEDIMEATKEVRNALEQLETTTGEDLLALKAIHKKLKKVRLWGNQKKRKREGEGSPPSKKAKSE